MNMLLLFPEDFIAEDRIRLSGRRSQHLQSINRVKVGFSLKAGLINGLMGEAQVTAVETDAIELQVSLYQEPPAVIPINLILALPRPKMLKRILQTIAAVGVKKLVLINSYKVEKSFWQSPWLKPEAIQDQLVLGLEQACDTQMPDVSLKTRFKPFVEDELPELVGDSLPLLAHPGSETPCPHQPQEPITLAVGPEGGFIPYEVSKLEELGFQTTNIGDRILRVETAVPVLLGKLIS